MVSIAGNDLQITVNAAHGFLPLMAVCVMCHAKCDLDSGPHNARVRDRLLWKGAWA